MKPPSDNTSRTTLLKIAGTLLSLGLLVSLLPGQRWGQVLAAMRQFGGGQIALMLGATLVSRLAVAGRWHLLLRACGIAMPLRRSIGLTFTGLFATNFLPTTVGGDVVRFAGVGQLGYDPVAGAASLVLDRVIGLLGMAIALPGGVQAVWPLAHPALPGAAGIVAPASSPARALWHKGRALLGRVLTAFRQARRQPVLLLAALLCTWVHLLCLCIILTVALAGLREPMAWARIAGLWTLVYFATLLPISINGLGVQELTVVYAFTHFGGVSMTAAVTVSLCMRIVMLLGSLPGAAFLPAVLAGKRAEPT